MTVYRIYANGHEFGADYRTLEAARAVIAKYRAYFPEVNYFIRSARA